MVSRVRTAAVVGLSAIEVDVEVDVASGGLPSLTIVGLPDKGVQEAKDRVRAAIANAGASLPPRKIVVNLAPSDVPKKGSGFDVPLAIGILAGIGHIAIPSIEDLFVGELSLDGDIRPIQGILPVLLMAKKNKYKKVIIPQANAKEASILSDITCIPVDNLSQLVLFLENNTSLTSVTKTDLSELLKHKTASVDMGEIIGQQQAKRALEIAAAGSHNIFFSGMPGSGKTMLARALAGILPQLSHEEAVELTNIYSIAGELPADEQIITSRPFRNPHHTVSKTGVIGGGTYPKPGEITLSHRGVLFLDELPEFPRAIIETTRT